MLIQAVLFAVLAMIALFVFSIVCWATILFINLSDNNS